MTEPLSDGEYLKRHFRCWHKTDLRECPSNVRFRR